MKRLLPSLFVAAALVVSSAAWADTATEIRALYQAFAAAQNARDLARVKALFLDSPRFLWVSDGMTFWGREAVLQRMAAFQEAEIWRVEPDLGHAVVVPVASGVAYLHLPLALVIGDRSGPATHRFLVSMLGTETAEGWRIAALFTTAEKPR